MRLDKKTTIQISAFFAAGALTALLLYKLSMLGKLEKDILFSCICLVFVTAVISSLLNKTMLIRLMVTTIIMALFFALLFFIFDKSGLWASISTFESLKTFIKDRGVFSSLVFLIIQILQVVAIPIPGVLTVSVGNIIFGTLWGSLLSYAGIILGSVLAFVIGRKFGYKLVVWIVGEENLKKVLKMIEGKDKVMFTMIFLLPFFPDDILCFVAGLTSMSLFFFTGMALTTRIITVGATALFTELIKRLITSGTVSSYIILTLIGAILLFIFYYTVKHGEKIQSFFENKFNKVFKRKETEIRTTENKEKE